MKLIYFSLPWRCRGTEKCGTDNLISKRIISTNMNCLLQEEGKFSNVLVIQGNDHVVTATDKAIGVHCSFDVGNKTESTDINIT